MGRDDGGICRASLLLWRLADEALQCIETSGHRHPFMCFGPRYGRDSSMTVSCCKRSSTAIRLVGELVRGRLIALARFRSRLCGTRLGISSKSDASSVRLVSPNPLKSSHFLLLHRGHSTGFAMRAAH